MTKAMRTDVERGFGYIITKECAAKIKETEIYPLGIQHQTTINEYGEQIPKKRTTHNLSNNRKSGLSINQRVIDEKVPEVFFGHTIHRVLHLIHHIWQNNPGKRIILNKVDIEKAYRRLHTTSKTSAKCIATCPIEAEKGENEEIAVALSRLPFGSKPAPAELSNASDITFDLARDLMDCDLWDPKVLPCPLCNKIPSPVRLPDNIPFSEALETDVEAPKSCKWGTDGYIDNGATVVLDTEKNKKMTERAEQCLLLALFLRFRPHTGKDEPIERGHVASIPKLKAEAFLTKVMILLGCEIDTRRFGIALPKDKKKAWVK